MKKLDGKTLDTGIDVIKVAEQFMPPSRPARLAQAVTNLKTSYADAQALAVTMRGESSKQLKQAVREVRTVATTQLGIIREIAREVISDGVAVSGMTASGGVNPLAGIEKLFTNADADRHINTFISNASQVLSAAKANWTYFAHAGCPQEVQTKLENALQSLVAARNEHASTRARRKDSAKEFEAKLRYMRKQMRVIGAVLKAHYGPHHKALELFMEAKFLYSKKSKKDTNNAMQGVTQQAIQDVKDVKLAA